MNKTGAGFGKDSEPILKSLTGLHTKKALGLFAGVQHVVLRKEIAFSLQREVLRHPVTETAAKTIIRVTGLTNGRATGHDRHRLLRHPQDGKLTADFKLLVIRLSLDSN